MTKPKKGLSKEEVKRQKMLDIIRSILKHVNGYPPDELTDEFVEQEEGSDLWCEIEAII